MPPLPAERRSPTPPLQASASDDPSCWSRSFQVRPHSFGTAHGKSTKFPCSLPINQLHRQQTHKKLATCVLLGPRRATVDGYVIPSFVKFASLHPRDKGNTMWNRTKCWKARSDVLTTSVSFGQPCPATNRVKAKDCEPCCKSDDQRVFQDTSKDSQTDKTHRPHNTFNLARSSHARHNLHFYHNQSMTVLRHTSSEIVQVCQSFKMDHPIRIALVLTFHLRSV